MNSEFTARREQTRLNRERKEEKRRFLHQRVAALHAEGMETRTMCERLRLSGPTVLDALRALGLSPHRGGGT